MNAFTRNYSDIHQKTIDIDERTTTREQHHRSYFAPFTDFSGIRRAASSPSSDQGTGGTVAAVRTLHESRTAIQILTVNVSMSPCIWLLQVPSTVGELTSLWMCRCSR